MARRSRRHQAIAEIKAERDLTNEELERIDAVESRNNRQEVAIHVGKQFGGQIARSFARSLIKGIFK